MIPDYGTPEFKAWWLDYLGLQPGTPEAESAWQDKVDLMEGRHLRRAPMVFVRGDICYDSPIDGRPITSHAARREDMARAGCIEYDPGMKQDADRKHREREAALDASIEASVEADFQKMPSAKRERLANELAAGVTAEPVRLTANGG